MEKHLIVKEVAERSGVFKDDVQKSLDAFFQFLKDELRDKQNFLYMGFGTFKVVKRAPRKARNPRTGEPVDVPEKKVIKFNPSSYLLKHIK